MLVELRAVAKRWDATSGLAGLTMQLRRGEVVALQGRSGSGKSTLLALLVGWCAPDAGKIVRHGGWALDGGWRHWRSTAIVPQVLGLADELSITENLEHVLRLDGRADRRTRDAAVLAMLAALDLDEQAARLPREVSLGQQQRAAVGRAAIIRPRLLLADEPTCHQDAAHAAGVLAQLRALADDGGAAVLIASHDPLVAAAADRVVSLD